MNKLINIKEQNNLLVVSAKELYNFLEVQTEFPKWCKRMFEYGLKEEKDFIEVVAKKSDNSKGGRSTLIDYILTLDWLVCIKNYCATLNTVA